MLPISTTIPPSFRVFVFIKVNPFIPPYNISLLPFQSIPSPPSTLAPSSSAPHADILAPAPVQFVTPPTSSHPPSSNKNSINLIMSDNEGTSSWPPLMTWVGAGTTVITRLA
ncbi:hypothetical protein GYMLUDRAFT_580145 [Collybiopsis luxurians FD-317 M1]|uniref:Uncharacterized protein n=1 Tax=Collybiopsis luxurians FD-317 M1 TaxID=944289 RepID=A0A0D0CQK3_9AGAR|nr:hypothetical protein GYMLUDRAFT_580145 [Collybiopsis luxurians FD-317 M1]